MTLQTAMTLNPATQLVARLVPGHCNLLAQRKTSVKQSTKLSALQWKGRPPLRRAAKASKKK